MKSHIIILCLIALGIISLHLDSFAQNSIMDVPIAEEMSFVYQSKVNLDSKILNAKTWVAKTFGDYKSVLQYEDKEAHRIIIKPYSQFYEENNQFRYIPYTVRYVLTFDFREDRFRIKIEDIVIHEKFYAKKQTDPFVPYKERRFMDEWDCPNVDFIKSSKCSVSYEKVDEFKKELALLKKKDSLLDDDVKEIQELEEAIRTEEKYIERCEQEEKEKLAFSFRTYFFTLLHSAYNSINLEDDF